MSRRIAELEADLVEYTIANASLHEQFKEARRRETGLEEALKRERDITNNISKTLDTKIMELRVAQGDRLLMGGLAQRLERKLKAALERAESFDTENTRLAINAGDAWDQLEKARERIAAMHYHHKVFEPLCHKCQATIPQDVEPESEPGDGVSLVEVADTMGEIFESGQEPEE